MKISMYPSRLYYCFAIVIIFCGLATAEEPPTISPFGEKETQRDDALSGLSNYPTARSIPA